MSRSVDGSLQVHRRIAECGAGFTHGLPKGGLEIGGIRHHAQALAAAARDRLQRDWETDLFSGCVELVSRGKRLERAWHHRHARRLHQFASLGL